MELEQIYLDNEEVVEKHSNWIKCVNTNNGSWAQPAPPPSFTHSAVFVAGIKVKDGKIQNPQDIISVHFLASQIKTYKYVRTKFFESAVYSEQY